MAQTGKNRYEMVVLFRPELEAQMDAPLKTVADLVKNSGGDIITDKDWGRKELAYKIAGETHAIYHQYELSLPADAPAKIDAVLNITDGVIRHLIVKIDEKIEKVLAEEKAARAAREAARAERERSE